MYAMTEVKEMQMLKVKETMKLVNLSGLFWSTFLALMGYYEAFRKVESPWSKQSKCGRLESMFGLIYFGFRKNYSIGISSIRQIFINNGEVYTCEV